jgi:hypothetical protein
VNDKVSASARFSFSSQQGSVTCTVHSHPNSLRAKNRHSQSVWVFPYDNAPSRRDRILLLVDRCNARANDGDIVL